MEIRETPIGDIKPYPNNPRINDHAVQGVADSIHAFGFQQPIVVDKEGVIIVGHTRYKAAQQLGLDKVPVVVADNLTPDEAAAYRLADNKTAEAAIWDDGKLAIELGNIELDMSPWFENQDLSTVDVHEQDVPETVESRAKRGDVWQLGRHRVMCGDSTNLEDVKTLMGDVRADLLITDPPYGMNLDTDYSSAAGSSKSLGKKHGVRGNTYEKVIGDNDDFSPALITSLFDNFPSIGEVFLFGADYYTELIPGRKEGSWLVWDKRKPTQADAIGSEFELIWSKGKHKRRVLRHDWFGFTSSENAKDAQHRVHPTQKPVTLIVDIIEQWGKDAEVIADLYGGSGTTLIAAEQLGRTCYMMELDPHYCDVIIQRWEDMTHDKAVLL